MFSVSVFCFATALVLSFVLTWIVRDQAVRSGRVAAPSCRRHIHTTAIPRVGGVAIFLAIALTGLLLAFLSYNSAFALSLRWQEPLAIFLPATIVFLLGVYDDLYGTGPYTKFAVQTMAALAVFLAGLRIVHLPILFGHREFGWVASLLLTVFWILFITNAFNLIDGVDGLAAGSALFSTVVVFIASTLNHNLLGLVITAALSGSLLGFLRFNFNPATIFLGDSGSLFVGFMLGAVALHGQKSPTMVAVAIPVVSCGLPMLETALSILRRFLSGKPIFGADREHIHHKLLARGLSQRQVALLLYGVSAAFGLLSLVLLLPGGAPVAVVLIVLGGIVWVAVQHLGYHEFNELRRVAQRTMEQKQVIVNNLAIRRGLEELVTCHNLGHLESILRGIFQDNDFDGFELQYALRDIASPGQTDRFKCSWNRFASHISFSWSLRMDLSNSSAEGCLTLHRIEFQHPLRVDVNLFGGEFVETLERTIRKLLLPHTSDLNFVSDSVMAREIAARAQSIGTA